MSSESDIAMLPCRSCGQARSLDEFRVYSTSPVQLMDFCQHCERQHGTLVLYRRYSGYGTPEIAKAVYAANRMPAGKRTADQVRLLIEPVVEAPRTREDAIKLELQRRELCRRRLIYFTTTFEHNYIAGWVHHDICRRLERFMERVERGESPRLMVFMPPRQGKSTLVSDNFPSWLLGHHPDWDIIIASYGLDLPLGFSRKIRDRVRDPEYQSIFEDTKIRHDSQAVEEWFTTRGGMLKAAGVGVGITGKGFKVGILDDPIKDYEAAQSEQIRKQTWGWWQSTFRTRAAPGAGILVVQTRWHDADVAGMLLETEEKLRKDGVPETELENWEVVSYPAIAEADEHLMEDGQIWRGDLPEEPKPVRLLRKKGDALHPERYNATELRKIKNTTDPAIWQAMYQQDPTPADGEYFKKDELKFQVLSKDYLPLARIFMCVDYAIDKKTWNNYTVAGIFALTSNDDLFLMDARRDRWKTHDLVTNIVDMICVWNPEVYAGERGAIHATVWPLIEAELLKRRKFVSVDESLVPVQDKIARARPLQGRMQRGKFFFSCAPYSKPAVLDAMQKELLRFPNGTLDDCVDMLAWGARLAVNLPLPTVGAPPKQESWRDKLNESSGPVGSYMAA